jgi:hypothetical protein
MKHAFMLLALLASAMPSVAQQKTPDEIAREKRFQEESAKKNTDTSTFRGWKHTGSAGVNLTQISFKDWVAGGDNALSYSLILAGASTLIGDVATWSNSYKFAFGQTRLAAQSLRKTDDEIYFESLLIYKLGTTVNPYGSLTFRSQFAPGYTYDAQTETAVSRFFDPAYITQSAGVAYQPCPQVTTRIGAALREIVTSQFPQYSDNAATVEIEKFRIQGGAESVTEAKFNIDDNVELVARLELFAPFNAFDKVIVRNDYAIVARVSKYVNTNLTVNLINDVNVSPRTQIKQALALGVTFNLF